MADDEESQDHNHIPLVGISLSDLLGQQHAEHVEHHRMAAEFTQLNFTNFIDGLSIDQLLALRRMLCSDNDSVSNNFFDGQIFSILRLVHKVDPVTGKKLVDIDQLTGESAKGLSDDGPAQP